MQIHPVLTASTWFLPELQKYYSTVLSHAAIFAVNLDMTQLKRCHPINLFLWDADSVLHEFVQCRNTFFEQCVGILLTAAPVLVLTCSGNAKVR
jgi:hypothetical protein